MTALTHFFTWVVMHFMCGCLMAAYSAIIFAMVLAMASLQEMDK